MKTPFLLTIVGLAGFLLAVALDLNKKLGRGVSNIFEPIRGGEMRRSVEQAGVFGGGDMAYTTGVFHGITRTVGRTAIGAFEVITFPIPPYHPISRHYSATPAYPDSYKPGVPSDVMFDHDQYLDFTGGEVFPFFPGSKFTIFDN